MKIGAMLVDDYAEIRLLMRMVITSANEGLFVAGEAASGEEALALLDECDPEVIVLDQMMPGLSGLETAEVIRERRPNQVMVFCSAYLDDQLRADASALGITEILAKDEIPHLPRAIQRAISSNGHGQRRP